jgi:hypothetical protein
VVEGLWWNGLAHPPGPKILWTTPTALPHAGEDRQGVNLYDGHCCVQQPLWFGNFPLFAPASEMAFRVELGLWWGLYNLCAVRVRGGSKANQSPGITAPWSDSTQNSSVNGYSAAPGHISHRPEEGRTDMWPLRAAGLVNGLWRCDERLL